MKNTNYLQHDGKKGMRWGYNNGVRNGKRTAADDVITDASSELISDTVSRFENEPVANIGMSSKASAAITAAKSFVSRYMTSNHGLPTISYERYATDRPSKVNKLVYKNRDKYRLVHDPYTGKTTNQRYTEYGRVRLYAPGEKEEEERKHANRR